MTSASRLMTPAGSGYLKRWNFVIVAISCLMLSSTWITVDGIRYCNHCQWNQSLFTCPSPTEYHSIACPAESSKCLKIIGNFTAWNYETVRYSIISGVQRVCLTELSGQHLAVQDKSAGCRKNLTTDTTLGPWRFVFQGDYCICDTDNCNHAGTNLPGLSVTGLLTLLSTLWLKMQNLLSV